MTELAICRSCGNTGRTMLGDYCRCKHGKALAGGIVPSGGMPIVGEPGPEAVIVPPKIERTTQFTMSAVQAPHDTPVLFVKLTDGYISLARIDDIERLIQRVRQAAYEDVQEYVVAHAFDTTVGRKIDDYITERLRAANSQPS